MKRLFAIFLLISITSHAMAQKHSIQYRSDGKNAFNLTLLTGFDKFIRETQSTSGAFGLGIEGSYTRTINTTVDVRVFQRFHRLGDESQFVILGEGNKLIHSYLVSGVSADISLLNYDRLSIKVSVGPQIGYSYKIRLKNSENKTPYDQIKEPFGGFGLGVVFETYPVNFLVLGLRFQYDQWFKDGDGNGNIYPGPYVGVRF